MSVPNGVTSPSYAHFVIDASNKAPLRKQTIYYNNNKFHDMTLIDKPRIINWEGEGNDAFLINNQFINQTSLALS